MLAGPLVLSSANRSGQEDARDAQQVLDTLGDDIHMVLDDGSLSLWPAVVGGPRVRQPIQGAPRGRGSPRKTLKRLSTALVLLVCTGNTCRKPHGRDHRPGDPFQAVGLARPTNWRIAGLW